MATVDASGRPGPSAPVAEFFIVGCPRSGTTLLRFLLDAHPEIAVAPETHFGERFVRLRAGERSRGRGDPDAVAGERAARLDAFCASDAFRRMGIDESTVRTHAARTPDDAWQPLRASLHAFAASGGVRCVGEKTPSHALHMRSLARAFPDARFLCLQRDPRAVASSWLRTSWSRASAIEVAEKWMRHSRAMEDARRVLPGRCLPIRYEALVSRPESVVASVCAFLGVTYDARMLAFHERRTMQGDAPCSPDEGVDNPRLQSPVDPSRIDAWRDEASRDVIRQIESVCGRVMRAQGYAPETSIRERVAPAIAGWPRVWRRRARRALRSSRALAR